MKGSVDSSQSRSEDQLIVSHVEIAKRIALRVARRCPDWVAREDLIGAAMVGLAEAAARYDDGREEPFLAFAEKRIRGAVLDELRRGDIMPRRLRTKARLVAETIRALERELARPPEDDEIANALGVPVEEYLRDLEVLNHVSVGSLAPAMQHRAPTVTEPAWQAERRQMLERIQQSLRKLESRDAMILSLYYMDGCTYAQIGKLLGVTASRVCQLHARAIQRLRVVIEEPEAAV